MLAITILVRVVKASIVIKALIGRFFHNPGKVQEPWRLSKLAISRVFGIEIQQTESKIKDI